METKYKIGISLAIVSGIIFWYFKSQKKNLAEEQAKLEEAEAKFKRAKSSAEKAEAKAQVAEAQAQVENAKLDVESKKYTYKMYNTSGINSIVNQLLSTKSASTAFSEDKAIISKIPSKYHYRQVDTAFKAKKGKSIADWLKVMFPDKYTEILTTQNSKPNYIKTEEV